MVVWCVISVAIVVMSLLNYIPALQIWHARVTRPPSQWERGGRARLVLTTVKLLTFISLRCCFGQLLRGHVH